jgi:DNA-binding MarR family transcriptional regulator
MDSAQRQPREQPLGPPLIGTLLRRPAEALRGRLLGELHAAGFSDLAESHLAVLRYPGPDGRRPSDLAADTGMTRQAMNYLLGQLQKAGYLTRRGDGGDQRSRRIDLTGRGHAALRAIQQAVSGIEAELEQELGPAQMTQLRSLLIKLNTTQAVRHAHSRATRRPTVQRDQRRQSGSLELPAARTVQTASVGSSLRIAQECIPPATVAARPYATRARPTGPGTGQPLQPSVCGNLPQREPSSQPAAIRICRDGAHRGSRRTRRRTR